MSKIVEKEISFEEALTQLETIVRKMEDGALSLDETVDAYTRGTALAKFCQEKLNVAQAKIEKLAGDTLEPLSVETTSAKNPQDDDGVPF